MVKDEIETILNLEHLLAKRVGHCVEHDYRCDGCRGVHRCRHERPGIRAGGRRSFSEYYTAKYDGALFSPALLENVVFSQHNLVTDRSFSEFNVILCRNVMIYFDRSLQHRVHQLFYESMPMYGILALGSKESLRFSTLEDRFEELDQREKIYRKVS